MNFINKKLIEIYNQQDNLLVISNYPPRGKNIHAAKIGGVSGFSKNTLIPLSKEFKKKARFVIVLADIIDGPDVYEEEGILVVRCWKRNSFSLYLSLLKSISELSKVNNILIEFEFASFGDFLITSSFPGLLFLLRILGKKTTVVLHQVIDNLADLSGHLGLHKTDIKLQLFTWFLKFYYLLVGKFVNKIVVLEEVFADRLSKFVPRHMIAVIPHGVEEIEKTFTASKIRNKLGFKRDEFIILSFGFVTWYKGNDILLKKLGQRVKVAERPVRIVIGGGPSPTQVHKKHYQRYFALVRNLVRNNKGATMTDVIPAEMISSYFAVADLVVFPYRTMMSSSGPLALALANKKPILISASLRDYFLSPCFQSALKAVGLSEQSLMMPNDYSDLPVFIEEMIKNGNLGKLQKFSSVVSEQRSFSKTANAYYQLLANPETTLASLMHPALAERYV